MLADNIKKFRKEQNMSQDELAEKLNVTRQSISLWENGQTQPSLDNIVALAKLFHVSTDEMLMNSDTDVASAPEERTVSEETSPKCKKSKGLIGFSAALVLLAAVFAVLWVLDGWPVSLLKGSLPAQSPSVSADSSDVPESRAETTETTEQKSAAGSTQAKKTQAKKPSAAKTTTTAAQTAKSTKATTTAAVQTTKKEAKDLFSLMKSFVIDHGRLNGDYCAYSQTADNYGGNPEEDFSLFYWGDTDKIEFCLHSVIDATYSINFYLYVPKANNGTYEYITSYYYRSDGESVYEAKGTIDAAEFSEKYPLNCSKYLGDSDGQNDFMEMSRAGICDAIKCLKEFLAVEDTGCTFSDFGFKNF